MRITQNAAERRCRRKSDGSERIRDAEDVRRMPNSLHSARLDVGSSQLRGLSSAGNRKTCACAATANLYLTN